MPPIHRHRTKRTFQPISATLERLQHRRRYRRTKPAPGRWSAFLRLHWGGGRELVTDTGLARAAVRRELGFLRDHGCKRHGAIMFTTVEAAGLIHTIAPRWIGRRFVGFWVDTSAEWVRYADLT